MNELLLAGLPVEIDFFKIYPWKLKDIINPKLKYYNKLFLLFVQKEDLGFPPEVIESYSLFHIIRGRAAIGEAFKNQVLETLKAFTQEDFIFDKNEFQLNGNIFTEEHWVQLRDVLAEENFIDLSSLKDKDEDNFANDRAREFKKRIEETRRLVNKYKKKNQPELSFLVNRFCAKSPNINLFNVWDLTFYQFKHQLDAVLFLETYDFNMMALVNGKIDTKKQKIVHWTENK